MHPTPDFSTRPTAAAAAQTHRHPLQLARRMGLLGLFACGLWGAVWSGQQAQAADMSAAAASALKVLALPLPESANANAKGGNDAPGAAKLASNSTPMPPHSITVMRGESIDAVLRRGLPGLPLSSEFMRQALAKANPRIFPRGTTYPVKPGTVLQLPSHESLRQQMLAQYPQASALFQTGSASDSDAAPGPDKRRWVRFP